MKILLLAALSIMLLANSASRMGCDGAQLRATPARPVFLASDPILVDLEFVNGSGMDMILDEVLPGSMKLEVLEGDEWKEVSSGGIGRGCGSRTATTNRTRPVGVFLLPPGQRVTKRVDIRAKLSKEEIASMKPGRYRVTLGDAGWDCEDGWTFCGAWGAPVEFEIHP